MESQTLYRVKKEDLPKLEKLLVKCFAHDPLYCKLIPEKETRERLLPELFKCDLTEFIETCEIYSDSEEMNSLLVVSDESEPYNPLTFYLTEAWASLKTDEYLIKEDPSLKTLWNFMRGRDYLTSPGRTSSCDLPGSGSGHAASWSGGHPDGRSEPLCPGASSYGFTGDSQPGQCAYV